MSHLLNCQLSWQGGLICLEHTHTQGAVLTEDNVRALRSAVLTLCRTMENVESVSSDMSAFTRDSTVQRNLKTLVQALSRLVDE